jgi:hypothetical protein
MSLYRQQNAHMTATVTVALANKVCYNHHPSKSLDVNTQALPVDMEEI